MFVRVPVASGTPARVKQFINAHVDVHLHDVHAMLRLPLPEPQIKAACNFAISAVLLNLISGLSVTLYDRPTTTNTGLRFKNFAIDFYPWHTEPPGALGKANGAECLYYRFRNPLAHNLGSSASSTVTRYQAQESGRSVDELREIEAAIGARPALLHNVATLTPGPAPHQEILNADSFYWGVREMVRRLTLDAPRMQVASTHL